MKKTSQGGEGRKQSRIYRLAGLTLPDDVGEDAALLQGEKQRNMMKPPIAAYTLDEINCGEEEEQEEKEQEEKEQEEEEQEQLTMPGAVCSAASARVAPQNVAGVATEWQSSFNSQIPTVAQQKIDLSCN